MGNFDDVYEFNKELKALVSLKPRHLTSQKLLERVGRPPETLEILKRFGFDPEAARHYGNGGAEGAST